MAFVEYQPDDGPIKPGRCNIGKAGFCTLSAADLAAIDARGAVAVLIEESTQRFAFSKPTKGSYSLRVNYAGKSTGDGSGRVFVRRVLERLGLPAKSVIGRHATAIDGGKLIVEIKQSKNSGGRS